MFASHLSSLPRLVGLVSTFKGSPLWKETCTKLNVTQRDCSARMGRNNICKVLCLGSGASFPTVSYVCCRRGWRRQEGLGQRWACRLCLQGCLKSHPSAEELTSRQEGLRPAAGLMALDAPRLLTPVTPSSSGPLRPVFPSHAIRPSLSCPIAGIFPKIQTFLLSPFLLPAGPSLYTLPGYAVSWPLDLWVLSAPSASSSRASPLLASQGVFLEPRMVLSLPLALPALTPPPLPPLPPSLIPVM